MLPETKYNVLKCIYYKDFMSGRIGLKKGSKHNNNKKELQPLYEYIKTTEKKRKKEYENFLEHASEHLSVPKDIMAGQAMISMTGNHKIRVSNYHSVKEYSTERIRLSLGKKDFFVIGSGLLIEVLRKDEIDITGNITDISFGTRG